MAVMLFPEGYHIIIAPGKGRVYAHHSLCPVLTILGKSRYSLFKKM